MKRLTVIILASLLASIVFGQHQQDIIPLNKADSPTVKKIMTDLVSSNLKGEKDSIVISIQQFDDLTKFLKNEDNVIKAILPSLVALLVVIISTWGAIYIGKRQINIQIRSGEEQLRSQEAQSQEQLKVSREQIQESSKLAVKQINSNNRQDWVIETRNTVSELMTQANLLNIELQETTLNSEKRKTIHEKFVYHKNKLFLLLKPGKDRHKTLLDSLNEFITTLDTHLLNSNSNNNSNLGIDFIPYDNAKFMRQADNVIESARNLLYDEWEKIQS